MSTTGAGSSTVNSRCGCVHQLSREWRHTVAVLSPGARSSFGQQGWIFHVAWWINATAEGTHTHTERLWIKTSSCDSYDKCTKVAILQFCFAAPPVTQFWGKLLLSCYHSCRIFLLHKRKILLLCYHKSRMFLTREILCSSVATTAECFSQAAKFCLMLPQKYSAVLVPQ